LLPASSFGKEKKSLTVYISLLFYFFIFYFFTILRFLYKTVDELTAQLHGLMKEKERLQADLSKIPISGGGPMMRRKAEMLEEQMDETERMMSKIRYSIRMRS
jgi:hypothetical protein